MKVVLDLPNWVKERHIKIFAGIELVAMKYAHENFWKVKDQRCNMCGECCRGFKGGQDHYFPVVDGHCIHLVPEPGTKDKFRCNIALKRPFPCMWDPRGKKAEKCSITYVEQSGK